MYIVSALAALVNCCALETISVQSLYTAAPQACVRTMVCALTTVVYTRFLEMAAAGNFLWRGVGGGSVGGGGTLTGGLHSSCAPRAPSRAHACAPLAARRKIPHSRQLLNPTVRPYIGIAKPDHQALSSLSPYL